MDMVIQGLLDDVLTPQMMKVAEAWNRGVEMHNLKGKRLQYAAIECEDGTSFYGALKNQKPAKSSKDYGIKRVCFYNPATIVYWTDGTQTKVLCMDNVRICTKKDENGKNVKVRRPFPSDTYSKEVGLAMCIAKKFYGNKGSFNDVFRKYIDDYDTTEVKNGEDN